MNSVPTNVTLLPAERAALNDLVVKKKAIQTWTQVIAEQGEQRFKEVIAAEQKLMLDIAKRAGLDLEKVLWNFDPQSGTLVPMQMRLA